MKRVELTIPQLGLIAGTRGMLGAGIGLLLAGRLKPEQRQAIGWTLLAVGALTTVPLIAQVIQGSNHSPEPNRRLKQAEPIPAEADI